MTQWYTILRIESDISLIQNPIGPLDSLRSYIALQGQYDCVWTAPVACFRASMSTATAQRRFRIGWPTPSYRRTMA